MTRTDSVSAAHFSAIRQRFLEWGDKLTDAQLLELADAYHDILRWRRQVRSRHPTACGAARRIAAQELLFENDDSEDRRSQAV